MDLIGPTGLETFPHKNRVPVETQYLRLVTLSAFRFETMRVPYTPPRRERRLYIWSYPSHRRRVSFELLSEILLEGLSLRSLSVSESPVVPESDNSLSVGTFSVPDLPYGRVRPKVWSVGVRRSGPQSYSYLGPCLHPCPGPH